MKAPGFGDRRKAMLQDMAVLTGGQVLSEEAGMKLENMTLEQLGKARRVVADKDTTTLIGGAGERAAIDGRIKQIRLEIDKATSTLRQGKAAGAAGQARRRRGGDPRRRAVGSRDEGQARGARRRDQCDQGGSGRGHRPGGGLALLRCVPALVDEEAQTAAATNAPAC